MLRRALEGRDKVLGVEHPHTLDTISNLGSLLQEQGEYQAAEEMHRRALKARERVLGVEHPDTLYSAWWLAHSLHSQKEYDEASALYVRALMGLKKALGPDHFNTRNCSSDYSFMLDETREEERKEMVEEVEGVGVRREDEEVPEPQPESCNNEASCSPRPTGAHLLQENGALRISHLPIRPRKPSNALSSPSDLPGKSPFDRPHQRGCPADGNVLSFKIRRSGLRALIFERNRLASNVHHRHRQPNLKMVQTQFIPERDNPGNQRLDLDQDVGANKFTLNNRPDAPSVYIQLHVTY